MASTALARALTAGGVRYSRVWEDHLLLERGLEPSPDDDLLSIAGAGCNVLNLLLTGPRSVTAIDLNPAQGALLELEVAALRTLDHDELTCFLGLRDGGDRGALYRRLRTALPGAARAFWDEHPKEVAAGVVHCGRLERYFRVFQTDHLPRLVDAGAIEALLSLEDREAQRRLFERRIATPDFRRSFRWYFGREMMARRGRHAEQFRYVDGIDVGDYFLGRFSFACTELPARGNFYLEFFLTSRYRDPTCVPPYLRVENFERLRSLLDRLTVRTGEIGEHLGRMPAATYSKVNLSDSCDYLSPAAYRKLRALLAARLRPGGRVAYWNLLVPHRPHAADPGQLRPLEKLSRELGRRDRAWFYRAFRVEEAPA